MMWQLLSILPQEELTRIDPSLVKSIWGSDGMNQNTAPTKANLMAAQATLNFSRKGYELLDKNAMCY